MLADLQDQSLKIKNLYLGLDMFISNIRYEHRFLTIFF